MQKEIKKDNKVTNMIKKIINHKHTKSVVALALVAGLVGYIVDFRKSEAFEYSSYMYNVHIESSNASDRYTAVAGDEVKLSFGVYDSAVLGNMTMSIYGKTSTATCEFLDITTVTSTFLETAYAQFYNPATCISSITLTKADVDAAPYIITTIPFEVKFTQQLPEGDIYPNSSANFLVTNTDDGSYVNVKRDGKSSDYVSNIHIESTTASDTTLASADNQVIVSYYINDYAAVSEHKATILDKEAKIVCTTAKEGVPINAESPTVPVSITKAITTSSTTIPSPATVDTSSAPASEVATPVKAAAPAIDQTRANIVPAQIKVLQEVLPALPKDIPAAILRSVIDTTYAKDNIPPKEQATFSGPAYCVATIDVSALDLESSPYTLVPFAISMIVTTRIDKTELKIEQVNDNSFVRIEKKSSATTTESLPEEVKVTVSDPVTTGGIAAVGLASPTPVPIIPQNIPVKNDTKNPIKKVDEINNTVSESCPFIKGFYRIGDTNPEIRKIRAGINKAMGTNLVMSDKFDKELFIALKSWQEKYKDIVLDPWGMESSSGYFYKTSNWSMNYQNGCPVPKFVLEKYKNN
jgi:hypothetical protein